MAPRRKAPIMLPKNAKIEQLPTVVQTDGRDLFEMIIKVMEQRDVERTT